MVKLVFFLLCAMLVIFPLYYFAVFWEPKIVQTKLIFGNTKKHIRSFLGIELPKTREKQIKVIGCGWSRSGTSSTKFALEQVGYKVYHYTEIMASYNQLDLWVNALEGDESDIDAVVDSLLEDGFNATLDWPSSLFCLDIFKRFPDSKVLLNVRDDEFQWFRSWKKLMYTFCPMTVDAFPLSYLYGPIARMNALIIQKAGIKIELFDPFFSFLPWVNYKEFTADEESATQSYLEMIKLVKETVPSDQLLIFNVKQGWDPLSKFLDISPPSDTFPRINSFWNIKYGAVTVRLMVICYPFAFLAILIGLYFALKFFCKRGKIKTK